MDQMTALIEELNRRAPQLELREYEPMSRHTTFRVGGPCALMALPKSEDEARTAVLEAHALGIVPFFLGNGSNLLVPDQGTERFVIKATGLDGVEREGNALTAGGGITLARLARFAQGEGLSGLEFAHGIPGTLGGAVESVRDYLIPGTEFYLEVVSGGVSTGQIGFDVQGRGPGGKGLCRYR